MKRSHVTIIAVIFIVITVAIAGCSSSQTAPSGSTAPAGAAAGSAANPAPQSGSAAAAPVAAATTAASSGASATGSQLFGGLSYNWVEYKMTGGETGGEKMTIYYKYNKQTGKCSMRFEGAGAAQMAQAGMSTEMDCSSTGSSQGTSDPNQANDAQFTKVGTEVITVPAGTFTADKYIATSKDGITATYWIAGGKPLLKMQGGDTTGSVVMELNGMG